MPRWWLKERLFAEDNAVEKHEMDELNDDPGDVQAIADDIFALSEVLEQRERFFFSCDSDLPPQTDAVEDSWPVFVDQPEILASKVGLSRWCILCVWHRNNQTSLRFPLTSRTHSIQCHEKE